MAIHRTTIATVTAFCLLLGCKSAHRARDHEYAQVALAVHASWQAPVPTGEVVNPIADELAGPQSVETYIQFALSQNPGIQAARKRLDAAAMRVPQAASLKDPMLDVTGWPFFPNTPQTASGRMTVDMMVSQEMPWFGKLATQAAAAEEQVNAARAQLAAVELQTIEAVKLAYYELYFVQQSIRITEQDRQFLADIVTIAESLYRTGETSQQDVLRLQAELSNVDGELIRMRQMQASAQAELAEALHVSPETPLAAVADLPAEDLPQDLDRLYEQAIDARPELHVMLAEIQRDRRMVEMADLEYRPDFTFKFGWGEMTTNRAIAPSADGIDNLTAGLSVNVPIYRKRLDAAVREAEAQVVASARQYDQMKDETQREVKRLFTEAVSQRDLSQLFRESIIPKTEQAFQISIREYQVGQTEFADLLGNWRELLRFHITHVQQETQLRKSMASLERVVGGYLYVPPSEVLPAPEVPTQPLPPR
jgi:cobalt-zinc-cadmium efflux system outer membrane protein